jgi:hypothetical protein
MDTNPFDFATDPKKFRAWAVEQYSILLDIYCKITPADPRYDDLLDRLDSLWYSLDDIGLMLVDPTNSGVTFVMDGTAKKVNTQTKKNEDSVEFSGTFEIGGETIEVSRVVPMKDYNLWNQETKDRVAKVYGVEKT